jgi:hypothetical protein
MPKRLFLSHSKYSDFDTFCTVNLISSPQTPNPLCQCKLFKIIFHGEGILPFYYIPFRRTITLTHQNKYYAK